MARFYSVPFAHPQHYQTATEAYGAGQRHDVHPDSGRMEDDVDLVVRGLESMNINQQAYCTLVLSSNKLLQRRKMTSKPQAAYS